MDNAIYYVFAVIFIMEFITGNLLNGFITVVNIMDRVKRRKISLVDQIITALAISRIALIWLVIINILLYFIYPEKIPSALLRMTGSALVVTNHFDLWMSTNLSIFYFLKVVTFSNSVFLYLKRRVTKVVSVTLMLSLAILLLNIVVTNIHIDVLIDESRRNMSFFFSSWNHFQRSRLLLDANYAFAFIPFAVSITAFLLLIFSLWKHHKKMQPIVGTSRDSSTVAHLKALQIGMAFLSIYTIFLISFLIQISRFEVFERHVTFLFGMITGITFPFFHSCVLILGNTKLRWASRSVLWWLRCKSQSSKPLES